MRAFFHIILLAGFSLLSACGDDPTCLDRDTSFIKIDFLDEDGLAKDIVLKSLMAIGNEDGFPEYGNDTTLNALELPLNPGARNTIFILEHTDTIDTLSLSYDVVARLISPECGLDASFSDLVIEATSFENTSLVSDIIDDQIETNIEITL